MIEHAENHIYIYVYIVWMNEALRTWTYLDRVVCLQIKALPEPSESINAKFLVKFHHELSDSIMCNHMCNHIEHVMIYHDLSNCLYCVQLFQTPLNDRRTGSTGSKRSERISSHRVAALAVWPPTKKRKEGVCPNALLCFAHSFWGRSIFLVNLTSPPSFQ